MYPIIIGILNALLPGLGYVLIKERVVFGWIVLTGSVVITIALLMDPTALATGGFFFTTTEYGQLLEGLSYILIMIAFAYDAYDLARLKRTAPEWTEPSGA